MKRIIGIVLLSLLVISCKTQAVLVQQETETEEAGDFEIRLNIAYKDSLAKANKEKIVAEKNIFIKKKFKDKEKRKFAALVEDIDIFLTRAKVIDSAKLYIGTPYHYGGMSETGIDCSALIYRAYEKNDLTLPRTSFEQSKLGKKVKKEKADIGDLIFFKTTRRKVISHVGMVVANYNGEILFIHASSSKGVMVSSLEQDYFKKKFVKIKRLIL